MKILKKRGFPKTSVFGKATLDLAEKGGLKPLFQELFPKLTEFWEKLKTMLFLIVLLVGCSRGINNDEIHVILIGLDGWGSYSVEEANMPNLKRLMQKGSYSLTAQNITPTVSMPNWASMFMGSNPDEHGYLDNTCQAPAFETALDAHGFFPTIFALLKDSKPGSKIGYFYEWDGISYLCPPDVLDMKKQILNAASYSDGVSNIANYIRTKKPDMTLIVFDEPDHTGHSIGHNTSAYYEKLTELDGYIGVIEQAVKEAGIYDTTVFIFTADHGGINKDHGGNTPEEKQIPFIVSGKNIKSNHIITSDVWIYDIAPTIAAIFNIPSPLAWKGKSIQEILIKTP